MSDRRRTRGLTLMRSHQGDAQVIGFGESVDYGLGDALYLDADSSHVCQLRPMLSSERTPGAQNNYPPGVSLLVCRPPGGPELRAVVKLPFAHRANTQANVQRAIANISEFNADAGHAFRNAAAGRDPLERGDRRSKET